MSTRVFHQSCDVVKGLGRKGVPAEFGIQIPRMIGRLQRKAEVIHRENVFQKLSGLEISNAPGLARWVEIVRQGVGVRVEVVIVQ